MAMRDNVYTEPIDYPIDYDQLEQVVETDNWNAFNIADDDCLFGLVVLLLLGAILLYSLVTYLSTYTYLY